MLEPKPFTSLSGWVVVDGDAVIGFQVFRDKIKLHRGDKASQADRRRKFKAHFYTCVCKNSVPLRDKVTYHLTTSPTFLGHSCELTVHNNDMYVCTSRKSNMPCLSANILNREITWYTWQITWPNWQIMWPNWEMAWPNGEILQKLKRPICNWEILWLKHIAHMTALWEIVRPQWRDLHDVTSLTWPLWRDLYDVTSITWPL